ncbi:MULTISPECIES: Gfo/Idh/MocA family oxidoreductase [unclassified Streptomyces]|uniref:Gfo/Idh/MocA family protein n=1 Tax=unclassified Streptomyces TaxID=2593676 RepID=UPI00036305A1|nr:MULTISPECIES: Gfo/Idh/MocA family oxidoreductase [unclassified Streptomyces]MYT32937.1 Gfo/Idh/MocA family oxidoreductase [Streptomyces sp. SID8354]
MKIGLLGTGFGRAHAAVYAARPDVEKVVVFGRTPAKLQPLAEQFGFETTTDLDDIYGDPDIGLVDVCLPTPLHADHAVRAMEAGKDVLCELPLATTMEDAHRIIQAQRATGRQAFVDLFARFNPVNEYILNAIAEGTYGPLRTWEIEVRTALLWEGYDIRLDSLVMDAMHCELDLFATALGHPESLTARGIEGEHRGSAGEALLTYPGGVLARCASSALMPKSYGLRGGSRIVFADGVLETEFTGGFEGQGRTRLVEYTAAGQRPVDLPERNTYAAVIDHVLACLAGKDTSRIAPESALDGLQLTLDIRRKINQQA